MKKGPKGGVKPRKLPTLPLDLPPFPVAPTTQRHNYPCLRLLTSPALLPQPVLLCTLAPESLLCPLCQPLFRLSVSIPSWLSLSPSGLPAILPLPLTPTPKPEHPDTPFYLTNEEGSYCSKQEGSSAGRRKAKRSKGRLPRLLRSALGIVPLASMFEVLISES